MSFTLSPMVSTKCWNPGSWVFQNSVVHSGEDLMDVLITCALRKVSLHPYETVAETVDETGHPLRVQLGQTELQEQARWKMTDQYQMPTDNR
jgi:hypothetical protein